MSIGTAIRDIRKERGMTQIELAQAAGMAVNSIRLYEADKRTPSIDQRIELAEALDCSPYDLMTESEVKVFSEAAGVGYWSRDDELRVEFGYTFSETETKLIEHFNKLNIHGRKEAVRSVEIIAGNPIFQRTDKPQGISDNTHPKQKKPSESDSQPPNGI